MSKKSKRKQIPDAQDLYDALTPAQRSSLAHLEGNWLDLDAATRAAFLAAADAEDISDFAVRHAIITWFLTWAAKSFADRFCAMYNLADDTKPYWPWRSWLKQRVPEITPETLLRWIHAFDRGDLHTVGNKNVNTRRLTKRRRR